MLIWIAYIVAVLAKPLAIISLTVMLFWWIREIRMKARLKAKTIRLRDLSSHSLPMLTCKKSNWATLTLILAYLHINLVALLAIYIRHISQVTVIQTTIVVMICLLASYFRVSVKNAPDYFG